MTRTPPRAVVTVMFINRLMQHGRGAGRSTLRGLCQRDHLFLKQNTGHHHQRRARQFQPHLQHQCQTCGDYDIGKFAFGLFAPSSFSNLPWPSGGQHRAARRKARMSDAHRVDDWCLSPPHAPRSDRQVADIVIHNKCGIAPRIHAVAMPSCDACLLLRERRMNSCSIARLPHSLNVNL